LWVVTYGDLMSLLLTFFVLIVSFSSTERVKFKAAISSIQEGMGIWPESAGLMERIQLDAVTKQSLQSQEFIEQLSEIIEELDMKEAVEVYNTAEGLKIIISDPLLFESGYAIIQPRFKMLLGKISKLIKAMTFTEIRIEGHTDNVPINTTLFPSNWDLSAARALEATKYIAFQGGLPPEKLSAVGYGEYRPREDNATAGGRAKNRRVEIHLLNSKK